ncbi:acetyl-CoA carboxylase, carboxyltransferase subunit beta [Candidatus Manganitrophus noduliformans]|uniref:Acetyl-coenzyme A carboxylase carboxyl transferase subunit beta n=1 Tax=Candidatus Manganitrophus noduliformans TaxID=2606439 RepID=A0A7X6DQQ6_9BACT|nr:acetyl-CoA carboxylase, carboxyltransferase subunit beta [Candidatus Manganitrophus noduliformans]NKE71615.1 acetyl-CoA carboxylase carboxyltransferase subunit beta [Candidatus Manganitrophus noduliformans]
MAWFKKERQPGETKKIKIPEGLWVKCNNCREIIYRKELERNAKVCPKCDYHFPISVEERIAMVVDEGSFIEFDSSLAPLDPLHFKDSARYKDRLKANQEKTGQLDALVIGDAEINQRVVTLGVLNFAFMAGSMGSVVGEKLTRGIERSKEKRLPLILFSASGGARMQEGILSLMQMAKTSAAIARLQEEKVPYISILTDPTFGGVTASFAMLGDIIIAEPKSLVGFAGPRVIEKTIKQQLPEGFQRAEFLLEHGMIDMIVERKRLRETLIRILSFF